MRFSFKLPILWVAGLLAGANFAAAVTYTLNNASATVVSGNTTSAFYQVSGAGAESGSLAAIYSSTISGQGAVSAHNPWTVEIVFNGAQPVLTSAFVKAGNNYLLWDAADLAAFNAGTFTSITLVQNGLFNPPHNSYLGISHAGFTGSAPASTTSVPDGGVTAMMLGAAIVALGLVARRRSGH